MVCDSTSKIPDAEKERKTRHFAFSGNIACVFYALTHGEPPGTGPIRHGFKPVASPALKKVLVSFRLSFMAVAQIRTFLASAREFWACRRGSFSVPLSRSFFFQPLVSGALALAKSCW
jgi:hypothetical protein